jgi:hypothetical protein
MPYISPNSCGNRGISLALGWASPPRRSGLLILQRCTAPRAVRADFNMLKFVQPLSVPPVTNCRRFFRPQQLRVYAQDVPSDMICQDPDHASVAVFQIPKHQHTQNGTILGHQRGLKAIIRNLLDRQKSPIRRNRHESRLADRSVRLGRSDIERICRKLSGLRQYSHQNRCTGQVDRKCASPVSPTFRNYSRINAL